MFQVCPDCEELMNDCYDPTNQNEEPCYACPNCGATWTEDEIEDVYREMGLIEPDLTDDD